MESFLSRYRNLVVLGAILVAQIVGLAMQVRRTSTGRNAPDADDQGGVRLIRLWANAVISPPERLIHGTKLAVTGVWGNYFDLLRVRQQNKDLEQTVERLRLEQAALMEDARQGQRLQTLLGFQQKYIYATLAAQAYGSSGSDRSHVFYIDKGSRDGLKPDMAVITPDGIVGKVRDVFPHTSQVLAVNDTTSGAGVILETTRIRGVLKGNAAGQLEVVGVTADQRIKPGENVLTAGGDLIFPRGLPVGVVEKVVRDPDSDGLIDIVIQPAAHLDRLDEVLVITSTQPRFPQQAQQDMAESAQAAANDQLKASAIMAEKLPGLIDPNLPDDKQPLKDNSNPNPMTRPPQPLHPDRFSPGAAYTPPAEASTSSSTPADEPNSAAPVAKPKSQPAHPAAEGGDAPDQPDASPAPAPAPPTTPQRNP
jgi:rod shape-determining protein MreC